MTVIPREGGVSSTRRPIDSITTVSGILDHPPSRVMTTERVSAFSRRIAPELCLSFRPQIKRAQGMPGAGWHPRSRVQIALVVAHTSIQVQPEQPGIPCAMGLRLIPSSPWRRIPFASIAGGLKVLRNPVGFLKTSAGLTPATGARTTRLCRPQSRRSSARGLRS